MTFRQRRRGDGCAARPAMSISVTSGVTNLLLLGSRTKGQVKRRPRAAGMPMVLVTRNPNVKTLKGFHRQGPYRGADDQDLQPGDDPADGAGAALSARAGTASSTR